MTEEDFLILPTYGQSTRHLVFLEVPQVWHYGHCRLRCVEAEATIFGQEGGSMGDILIGSG